MYLIYNPIYFLLLNEFVSPCSALHHLPKGKLLAKGGGRTEEELWAGGNRTMDLDSRDEKKENYWGTKLVQSRSCLFQCGDCGVWVSRTTCFSMTHWFRCRSGSPSTPWRMPRKTTQQAYPTRSGSQNFVRFFAMWCHCHCTVRLEIWHLAEAGVCGCGSARISLSSRWYVCFKYYFTGYDIRNTS